VPQVEMQRELISQLREVVAEQQRREQQQHWEQRQQQAAAGGGDQGGARPGSRERLSPLVPSVVA
jgi:hypothetical protein